MQLFDIFYLREKCRADKCGYYFAVNCIAHFDNSDIVRKLMELNRLVLNIVEANRYCFVDRNVVVPLLVRPFKLWSNYWGNIANNGFYARSRDYNELISFQRK